MMKFRAPSRKHALGFDLTPMIDVVFLLIIFFLFTSQFAQAVRTPVELPEQAGDDSSTNSSGDMVLDISADGTLWSDGRRLSVEQFVALVVVEADRAGGPEAIEVLVRADGASTAATVNEVAGRLAQIGVRRWKLGTALPPEGR